MGSSLFVLIIWLSSPAGMHYDPIVMGRYATHQQCHAAGTLIQKEEPGWFKCVRYQPDGTLPK